MNNLNYFRINVNEYLYYNSPVLYLPYNLTKIDIIYDYCDSNFIYPININLTISVEELKINIYIEENIYIEYLISTLKQLKYLSNLKILILEGKFLDLNILSKIQFPDN